MKTIEKMTWMSPAMKYNPPDFPCMICRGKQGDYRVVLTDHTLTLSLVVCADCANRSEADLLDILTAKPKRR